MFPLKICDSSIVIDAFVMTTLLSSDLCKPQKLNALHQVKQRKSDIMKYSNGYTTSIRYSVTIVSMGIDDRM